MEEKKTKEVAMGVVKNESSTPKEQQQKLTYEQLNTACIQLSQQNQQMENYIKKLQNQIQEMAGMLQTKRMDYLFKVVEVANLYDGKTNNFFQDFVVDCIAEIEQSLAIPAEKEQPEKKDNTEE